MTLPSPLQESLEQFEVNFEVQLEDVQRSGAAEGMFKSQVLSEFLPWGDGGCSVLATTGIVELEYAALKKSSTVFDASCRGTLELTGEERLECINRLTTQQLLDLKEGESRVAFLISRTGGVLADAIIHVLPNKILLDMDITVVDQVCDHITSYIVMEDVQTQNVTSSTHWMWCLGPTSQHISIEKGTTFTLPLEFLGIDGVAIALHPSEVVQVWGELIEQGITPIGWHALNMARVELGKPIFMIDFDSSNLPHETSLVQSRVRFDKGCYLGQEIVARMESLGQPKQRLVKLQMKTDDLPIAGAQLFEDESGMNTPIGVVTSSAISPLGGGIPCVIAMVGKKNATPGADIYMYVGSTLVAATVAELTSS
ncbi:MAG: aminomethyl transferase family protein [Phycisphaerales bacterium]|nr:aminomethyl transferase family protein [Planctomycetota bacterium]MBL6997790.1 aminomethyl transferase family protein [Phycisphaerales bacterium]